MSVYSELINLALEMDQQAERPIGDLVAVAAEFRNHLGRAADAASRLGDSLAYDVVLIRLCERVGIAHEIGSEISGVHARQRAESALAEQLPLFATAVSCP